MYWPSTASPGGSLSPSRTRLRVPRPCVPLPVTGRVAQPSVRRARCPPPIVPRNRQTRQCSCGRLYPPEHPCQRSRRSGPRLRRAAPAPAFVSPDFSQSTVSGLCAHHSLQARGVVARPTHREDLTDSVPQEPVAKAARRCVWRGALFVRPSRSRGTERLSGAVWPSEVSAAAYCRSAARRSTTAFHLEDAVTDLNKASPRSGQGHGDVRGMCLPGLRVGGACWLSHPIGSHPGAAVCSHRTRGHWS